MKKSKEMQLESTSAVSFSKDCLLTVLILGVFFNVLPFISLRPYAIVGSLKTGVIIFWLLLSWIFILFRSFLIAYQCKRGLKQTFDRACPNYVAIAALVLVFGTMLWPAS